MEGTKVPPIFAIVFVYTSDLPCGCQMCKAVTGKLSTVPTIIKKLKLKIKKNEYSRSDQLNVGSNSLSLNVHLHVHKCTKVER